MALQALGGQLTESGSARLRWCRAGRPRRQQAVRHGVRGVLPSPGGKALEGAVLEGFLRRAARADTVERLKAARRPPPRRGTCPTTLANGYQSEFHTKSCSRVRGILYRATPLRSASSTRGVTGAAPPPPPKPSKSTVRSKSCWSERLGLETGPLSGRCAPPT
jgi:hypothetical protein